MIRLSRKWLVSRTQLGDQCSNSESILGHVLFNISVTWRRYQSVLHHLYSPAMHMDMHSYSVLSSKKKEYFFNAELIWRQHIERQMYFCSSLCVFGHFSCISYHLFLSLPLLPSRLVSVFSVLHSLFSAFAFSSPGPNPHLSILPNIHVSSQILPFPHSFSIFSFLMFSELQIGGCWNLKVERLWVGLALVFHRRHTTSTQGKPYPVLQLQIGAPGAFRDAGAHLWERSGNGISRDANEWNFGCASQGLT